MRIGSSFYDWGNGGKPGASPRRLQYQARNEAQTVMFTSLEVLDPNLGIVHGPREN